MSERGAQDERPQPDAVGHRGDTRECRERFQRRDRRGIRTVPGERVEEMIRHPDRVEVQVLRPACPLAHGLEPICPDGNEKP